MKKQAFPIILAAALGAVALIGGNLFTRASGICSFEGGGFSPFSAVTVHAQTTDDYEFLPRVYDEADLLTDDEESELLDRLDSLSEEYYFDVAVATVQSTDGVAMNKFTDTFYDDNYYGLGDDYDGILFMVSIGDREWHITTHGYGMTVFNQDGLDYLKEKVTPELKDEDFAGAFNVFADQCELFLAQAETGTPYDASTLPTEPLSLMWIPISIAIGFALALLCTMGMRAQLKSVRSQDSAVDYVRSGSMNVTRSNDIFLYHTVTRTERPKESDSSSTGGSDSSHGGTGGSF